MQIKWVKYETCYIKIRAVRREEEKGGEEWLGLESDEEQLEKLHREHEIWIYTWKMRQHTVTDVAIWHWMK